MKQTFCKVLKPAKMIAFAAALALLAPALTAPTQAQTQVPPYHASMARLAELLGGLHYIRPLCGFEEASKWRNAMLSIITAEKPDALREADLVEHFNRSYETLKATHASCTSSTRQIMTDYLAEGANLAAATRARFAD